MKTYQVNRILSEHEMAVLSCKLQRAGFECAIHPMGATTIIEVWK